LYNRESVSHLRAARKADFLHSARGLSSGRIDDVHADYVKWAL